jgi:hypothetical protein
MSGKESAAERLARLREQAAALRARILELEPSKERDDLQAEYDQVELLIGAPQKPDAP